MPCEPIFFVASSEDDETFDFVGRLEPDATKALEPCRRLAWHFLRDTTPASFLDRLLHGPTAAGRVRFLRALLDELCARYASGEVEAAEHLWGFVEPALARAPEDKALVRGIASLGMATGIDDPAAAAEHVASALRTEVLPWLHAAIGASGQRLASAWHKSRLEEHIPRSTFPALRWLRTEMHVHKWMPALCNGDIAAANDFLSELHHVPLEVRAAMSDQVELDTETLLSRLKDGGSAALFLASVDTMRKLVERFPFSTNLRDALASALFASATAYARAGDAPSAARALREALSIGTSSADPETLFEQLLAVTPDSDKASVLAERALLNAATTTDSGAEAERPAGRTAGALIAVSFRRALDSVVERRGRRIEQAVDSWWLSLWAVRGGGLPAIVLFVVGMGFLVPGAVLGISHEAHDAALRRVERDVEASFDARDWDKVRSHGREFLGIARPDDVNDAVVVAIGRYRRALVESLRAALAGGPEKEADAAALGREAAALDRWSLKMGSAEAP